MRDPRNDNSPLEPQVVAPAAFLDRDGTVTEANDGRGRRLLEAEPQLVDYGLAVLAGGFPATRFTWITDQGQWLAITIERLSGPEADSVLIEILPEDPPYGLTVRELDVLTLAAGGLSNPEIASYLVTSARTVSSHIASLLEKLDQPTRAGAAGLAVEQGLLRAPVPGGGRSIAMLTLGTIDQLALGRISQDRAARTGARARPHTTPRPYIIGAALPVGSQSAEEAQEMRRGAELAMADINARGGIAGRPVEQRIVEIPMSDEGAIRTGLEELVEAEVDAIVTGHLFVEDHTLYRRVTEYGCPLLHVMTSEAQSDWVRQDPERLGRIFQVGPTERHYGDGFIAFIDELRRQGTWVPGNRRLAIIDTDIPGGRIGDPKTLTRADDAGWDPAFVARVAAEGVEWGPVLAKIRELAPAAILLAHPVAAETASFQDAFLQDPTDSLLYELYAPSLPEYMDLTGASSEGVVWATASGLYNDRLGGALAARYQQEFGIQPSFSLVGVAYDQVNLLARAWAQVGNPRAFGKVADALRQTPYRGVNGAYDLSSEGQKVLSYPWETPDLSVGMAQLVFQIQGSRHRVLGPAPYADSEFRLPPWFRAARATAPDLPG